MFDALVGYQIGISLKKRPFQKYRAVISEKGYSGFIFNNHSRIDH